MINATVRPIKISSWTRFLSQTSGNSSSIQFRLFQVRWFSVLIRLESKGKTVFLLKANTKPIADRKRRKVYELPDMQVNLQVNEQINLQRQSSFPNL